MLPINKVAGLVIYPGKTAAEDLILLIWEKYSDTNLEGWNVIKGTMEIGDTSLQVALIRECQEEVGLDQVEILDQLTTKKYGTNEQPKLLTAFWVKTSQKTIRHSKQQPNEAIKKSRWFSRQEILSLDKESFINDMAYELSVLAANTNCPTLAEPPARHSLCSGMAGR